MRSLAVLVLCASCAPAGDAPAKDGGTRADALALDAGGIVAGDCVETYHTHDVAPEATYDTRYYSATVDVGDVAGAPAVTAWLCEFECFGSSCTPTSPPCRPDSTCAATGTPPPFVQGAPLPNCRLVSDGVLDDAGRLYVSCGAKSATDYADSTPDVLQGLVAHRVYARVR